MLVFKATALDPSGLEVAGGGCVVVGLVGGVAVVTGTLVGGGDATGALPGGKLVGVKSVEPAQRPCQLTEMTTNSNSSFPTLFDYHKTCSQVYACENLFWQIL